MFLLCCQAEYGWVSTQVKGTASLQMERIMLPFVLCISDIMTMNIFMYFHL